MAGYFEIYCNDYLQKYFYKVPVEYKDYKNVYERDNIYPDLVDFVDLLLSDLETVVIYVTDTNMGLSLMVSFNYLGFLKDEVTIVILNADTYVISLSLDEYGDDIEDYYISSSFISTAKSPDIEKFVRKTEMLVSNIYFCNDLFYNMYQDSYFFIVIPHSYF